APSDTIAPSAALISSAFAFAAPDFAVAVVADIGSVVAGALARGRLDGAGARPLTCAPPPGDAGSASGLPATMSCVMTPSTILSRDGPDGKSFVSFLICASSCDPLRCARGL